jgi:alkyl sulfatase BDS1-like metallo-beta-lactamase superfamily hydrolase
LGGVLIELIHAPSETDDEIVAWLPELDVLLSAEVIQGECLANVHTLRGTRYRDPSQWVATLDALRQRHSRQPAQWLVPAHGRPQAGAQAIAELLTTYRDAIAYLHDQAVRWINQGCTPEELAQRLPGLPEHLARHDWLGEHYGTVRHSVRQVFTGLLGWFDGDPSTLDPLPPLERAQRWIALAGGRDRLLAQASGALASEGLDGARWAAELCTLLIRSNPQDTEARSAKALALRTLGYDSININWRNWYLTAAHELEGRYQSLPITHNALAAPDILAALPPAQLLATLSVRVAAERCMHLHQWLRLAMPDIGQLIELELRHGVLQIHEQQTLTSDAIEPTNDIYFSTKSATPTLMLPHQGLVQLFVQGPEALFALLSTGEAQLHSGELSDLADFFACFDPRPKVMPVLAGR